ncbi:MAG TPA: septum formation initiator family protein [Rhizobiales bacterium]|nr:septum formation initiator [bacterium BMS3Bbin10]HDO51897.1 septum formation initiator family protein [Hyphomicrobiales bacterium]
MSIRSACVALICFGFLGYFAYNLFVGDHGLEARARLQTQVKSLEGELNGLQAVRERLDRDVALMRADKLDPDMLDERARMILNFSHPKDIVIMDKSPAAVLKP